MAVSKLKRASASGEENAWDIGKCRAVCVRHPAVTPPITQTHD